MMRLRWQGRVVRSAIFGLAIAGVLTPMGLARAQYVESGASSGRSNSAAPEAVPGEYLVKFKSSKSALSAMIARSAAQGMNSILGDEVISEVKPLISDRSIVKVTLSDTAIRQHAALGISGMDVLAGLGDEVETIEPNFIYRAQGFADGGVPNDPDFSKLWGLKNTGQLDSAGQLGSAGADINVTPVWADGITGKSDLLVAVIDTGIDFNHPDLRDNIFVNEGESGALANNGIDDDGNGYVDDVYGYDFANKRGNGLDDHNHGTHCAGTIGGHGDNGLGVAGVIWKVKLLPVKFLTAQGGGTLEGAIESINYSRKMGAKIMSNSWGGGGFSSLLRDAIQATRDAGILFVAAAGNETNDNDKLASFPASYDLDNIVSVAATDNRDVIAKFSNWGATKVHVAAPGVKVYSTVRNGGYATYSGTSMATPHVAGVAALAWSVRPDWTYADLKTRLITGSDPVKGLKKKVVANGRVNAYNTVYSITPPSLDPDETLWRDVPEAGVFESEHPYANRTHLVFPVTVPGAKFVRLVFEKFDVEQKYDIITFESPTGTVIEELTGTKENYTTEYLEGNSFVLRFKADESFAKWGFKVAKVQAIY